MKKLVILLVIAIVITSMIATFSLTGCKETEKELVEEKTDGALEEKEEEVEKDGRELTEAEKAIEDGKKYAGTTIKVILSTDAALSGTKTATEEFEKLTGITVELNEVGWDVLANQVPTVLASGIYEFDVMDIWEELINTYGLSGGLVDLSGYMENEIKDVVPALMVSPKVGDSIYAFPYLPSWQIMFYNKELFKEAGLDPEVYPKSIDEFKEFIVKLNRDTDNDGVIDQYAYVADWTTESGIHVFYQFQKAFGGEKFEVVNNEVKMLFDDAETIKAINFMAELYNDGLVDPGILTESQWDVTTLFNNGVIAFMQMWDMYAGFLDEETLANTGFFPFPGIAEGVSASAGGHEFLGIPDTSPNQEAAMAYVKYICSKENLKKRSIEEYASPAYVDHYSDPEIKEAIPWLDVINIARQNEIILYPPIINAVELYNYAIVEVHKVIMGDITAEEAAKNIQDEADSGHYSTIEEVIDKYDAYRK